MNEAIVLFDGVCNLCNGAVDFVITRDKRGYFRFATLQSPQAEKLLATFPGPPPDSVVLLENGRWYVRSTAALRIARKFGGAWPLLYALIAVPRPLRDLLYDMVARSRYRWFGRRATCRIATPELRARFLSA